MASNVVPKKITHTIEITLHESVSAHTDGYNTVGATSSQIAEITLSDTVGLANLVSRAKQMLDTAIDFPKAGD